MPTYVLRPRSISVVAELKMCSTCRPKSPSSCPHSINTEQTKESENKNINKFHTLRIKKLNEIKEKTSQLTGMPLRMWRAPAPVKMCCTRMGKSRNRAKWLARVERETKVRAETKTERFLLVKLARYAKLLEKYFQWAYGVVVDDTPPNFLAYKRKKKWKYNDMYLMEKKLIALFATSLQIGEKFQWNTRININSISQVCCEILVLVRGFDDFT